MSDYSASPSKPKKSFFAGLAWWREDPVEVARQVSQYKTLALWKSARGQSMLLCVFSAAITLLLKDIFGMSTEAMALEIGIWSVLGVLMWRGQRWAFVASMVLWTVEKITVLGSGSPIATIIWWAIYMNVFMLGFRVEGRRRQVVDTTPRRIR